MKIKITTPLSEQECKALIEKTAAKDRRDAEIIVKVLEGRTAELGAIQRKAAGKVLSEMMKLMSKEKQEYLKDEFRVRAQYGTERFISYNNGNLIIEVPDQVILGAQARGREKAGWKELQKRFKASYVEQLEEF